MRERVKSNESITFGEIPTIIESACQSFADFKNFKEVPVGDEFERRYEAESIYQYKESEYKIMVAVERVSKHGLGFRAYTDEYTFHIVDHEGFSLKLIIKIDFDSDYDEAFASTSIAKYDVERKMDKGLGIDVYNKLPIFFKTIANNTNTSVRHFVQHGVAGGTQMTEDNWKKVFADFLSQNEYEHLEGYEPWQKVYSPKNITN